MDPERRLGGLSANELAPMLCQLFGDATAEASTWAFQRVGWTAVNPGTLGIYRVHGTARTSNGDRSFSMVFKAVGDVDYTGHPFDENYIHQPPDVNYWKREPLVFESGILDAYRGSLVPVRCFGVEHYRDSAFMWLEELREPGGRSAWPLDRHVLAARHLGRFSGDHVGSLPSIEDYPFLCQNFIHEWMRICLLIGTKEACESDEVWRHPGLHNVFSQSPRRRVASLLSDAEAMLQVERTLPLTLSHHDAHWDNLFRRSEDGDEQTGVIDWGFLGLAAIGEDLGHQVGVNVFHQHVAAADASRYEVAAFRAFQSGLMEAGVDVPAERVRLLSQAVAALQVVAFAAAHVEWLSEEDDEGEEPWPAAWAATREVDVDELLRRWAAALMWLLDLGERARRAIDAL